MRTTIIFLVFLTSFNLFGQKTSRVLKIDLDTTVLFIEVKHFLRVDTNGLKCLDFLIKDTNVIKGLHPTKMPCFVDLEKTTQRLLKGNLVSIYYKGDKVKTYKTKYNKGLNVGDYSYFYYFDKKTNRQFLILRIFKGQYESVDRFY